MNRFGFVRITAASTKTAVADPDANGGEVLRVLAGVADSDLVLFPELGVTGYTCADLFGQSALLDAAIRATLRVAEATRGRRQLVVVGLPVAVGGSLYNCAAALCDGAVLGIVPKQFIPNYKEFYESRWFSSASGREPAEVDFGGRADADARPEQPDVPDVSLETVGGVRLVVIERDAAFEQHVAHADCFGIFSHERALLR